LPALFTEYTGVEEEWWPARFVLRDGDGRQIDFHPIELDEEGDGWKELTDGTRGRYPAAISRVAAASGDVRSVASRRSFSFDTTSTPATRRR
jgi:Aminoglycoside-2''-adenylyltransferase